ncbi:MAG: DUF616 domain-containing protein [Alphaproteobacteria bacterium]|nr:DUF616 domain-containing protein [Alphaproteobacteria bacterium]
MHNRATKEYKTIKKSKFFNKRWYLKTYPDVAAAKMDPVQHYLQYGWRESRNPCATFNGDEYLRCNPDVKAADICPLYHYEKFGKKENRPLKLIACVDSCTNVFPKGATNKTFVSGNKIKKNGKVAIFASFFTDGIIPDYVVYYLEKLKAVTDNIIFIADNPVFASEMDKIKPYCTYAVCKRHGEYDFGSYKRGVLYLARKQALDKISSLILCNDSCFGPVGGSFVDMFNIMRTKKCDFWGVLDNQDLSPHVQSYFMCFKSNVLKNKCFYDFFASVKKQKSVEEVIRCYELGTTKYFVEAGFVYKTYVNSADIPLPRLNKTVYPLYLIKKFSFPLVKIKALNRGWSSTAADCPNHLLEFLRKHNKDLYGCIISWYESRVKKIDTKTYLSQKQLLLDSGMWDSKYYKKYNVKSDDLLDFYIQVGWQLGHNPSKFFNNDEYLSLYKHVNMCPLLHFLLSGSSSGYTVQENLYKPSNKKIKEYWQIRDTRKSKRAVYTCITGNYDDLISHYYIDNTYDYICFTDNTDLIAKQRVGIWEIRPLVYNKLNPSLNNRWHKVFPHICLKEYNESIYIDSNINVLSSYIFDAVAAKQKAFLLPQHFGRKCIYSEAAEIKNLKLVNPATVNVLMSKLRKEGFPEGWGLGENNILYRNHKNMVLRRIMNDWWYMLTKFCARDQLSLMYLFWKHRISDIKSHFIINTRQSYKDFRVFRHNSVIKKPNNKKRYLCLFAGYSAKGKMEDYAINYIRHLSKIAEVHYFADCQMKRGELAKISDFVKFAGAERHKMYDFGSWSKLFGRFSYEDLYKYDGIILANDSCYGPIFPLENMFNEMERRNVDFWGCTQNNRVREGTHIQSYFVVLSRDVFTSYAFTDFLKNVKVEKVRSDIVKKYEYRLTGLLSRYGFTYDTYIKPEFLASSDPIDLLNQRCPLLKVKNFTVCGHTMKYSPNTYRLISYLKDNYEYDVNYILRHLDYLDDEYMTRLDFENWKFCR